MRQSREQPSPWFSARHRNSPAGSDFPAARLGFAQTTHTGTSSLLHTSSLLQSAASQRARTSTFTRSKKQFHQSGWDAATADGLICSGAALLLYQLFVLPAQLSTSQLSAFQGPACQNGSITALVTALWTVLFWENSSQPPQINWIWLAQRQAVQEQLQAVSAEWRFPHPKIADRCYWVKHTAGFRHKSEGSPCKSNHRQDICPLG